MTLVMEYFGPTFQGEGPLIGRTSHFIRFGGCDFRCTFCDSMFAVEPASIRANAKRMTDDEIVDALAALEPRAKWVTLTGGNPALQDLLQVVLRLKRMGFMVTAETQGSIFKGWLRSLDLLIVSPKPPSMVKNNAGLTRFMEQTNGVDRVMKVPVFTPEDFEWAMCLHSIYPTVPFYLSVGNMKPPGKAAEGEDPRPGVLEALTWLLELSLTDPRAMDVTVLPQMHVLAWGNRQGV